MLLDLLEVNYRETMERAQSLKHNILEQLNKLLDQKNITLGVPIESRIKTWDSILQKIDRKLIDIESINKIDDLIGIRVILLFRKDVDLVDDIIKNNFKIQDHENTGNRLDESQFGYQSYHYVVKLLDSWINIPTMSDLGDLSAEIQVRTLPQHIWAAASHKLQYKSESNVPASLRRAIHRVSAMLEVVDIEFDRILESKNKYLKEISIDDTSDLNVDILSKVLDEQLPKRNKKDDEEYSDLLEDLKELSITTAGDVRKILAKHERYMRQEDQKEVESRNENDNYVGTTKERISRGIFYAHVGLVRAALRKEFGKDVIDNILKNRKVRDEIN